VTANGYVVGGWDYAMACMTAVYAYKRLSTISR
jgi:hypothetical protein